LRAVPAAPFDAGCVPLEEASLKTTDDSSDHRPYVGVDGSRRAGVCLLTIRNESKLNALSTQVERDLAEALSSSEVRDAGCVVVTGNARAFSAGADISEFRDRHPAAVMEYYRDSGGVYERFAELPQPTIAAISGHCLGGGLELALCADFRVADTTASLGFPELGLGILPSSGGTVRMTRLLGPARAKEVILLGRRLTAEEAYRLGLLTELVDDADVLETALDLGESLAAGPALATQVTKQTIDAAAESPQSAGLLLERYAYTLLSQTDEATAAADEFTGHGR
jgi:enoyl-CoA hydratase/carnithine racemase